MDYTTELQNIKDALGPGLSGLLRSLELKDLHPHVVGGIVRDWALKGELGRDWDIELHSDSLSVDEAKETLLEETTKLDMACEELPLNVFRITQGRNIVELTFPRIEVYKGQPPFGHSDFEAEWYLDLDLKRSAMRRDFTVNSMFWELSFSNNSVKLKDPYKGQFDLEDKILRPVNTKEFFFDPVRFLRSIRFQIKLGFEFSDKLKESWRRFDLRELSGPHMIEEWNKVAGSNFLERFFELTEKNKLNVPADCRCLQKLELCESPDEVKKSLIIDPDVDLNDMKKLGRFFQWNSRLLKAERDMGTILLRIDLKQDWEKVSANLQEGYRQYVQRSGMSGPFEALLGEYGRGPILQIFKSWQEEDIRPKDLLENEKAKEIFETERAKISS